MVHRSRVEPETWAVMAGRPEPSAGAPLNVPPVLASNFGLGSGRAYSRDDATRRAAIAGQTHLPPGLLRLSVGCEHPDDLWRDLQQALAP